MNPGGMGIGIFLLLRSTQMLILRGDRACMAPSIYLDVHGEVRGLGLTLVSSALDAPWSVCSPVKGDSGIGSTVTF